MARITLAFNLPNIGQIANLPLNAIVESPAVLTGMGVQPVAIGALPLAVTELLRRELAVVNLCYEPLLWRERQMAFTFLYYRILLP
jgi:alpha-galactosidase/6-phospho-beta-glucosidase family protein